MTDYYNRNSLFIYTKILRINEDNTEIITGAIIVIISPLLSLRMTYNEMCVIYIMMKYVLFMS